MLGEVWLTPDPRGCVHTRTDCAAREAGPTPVMGGLPKKGEQTWPVPVAWKGGHAKNRHVEQQGTQRTNSDIRARLAHASTRREMHMS